MRKRFLIFTGAVAILCFSFIFSEIAVSAASGTGEQSGQKYLLRYRFKPGDVFRWDVTQQLRVRTSMLDKTEILDTRSRSTKTWTVKEIDKDGVAVLEHRVEEVDMHHQQSEGPSTSYNSQKDKDVPAGYEHVAEKLNVPLTHLSIDSTGKVLKRISLVPYMPGTLDSKILIPLPEEPVQVGQTWKVPEEVMLGQSNGSVKKVKIQKLYTLESVKNGIAELKYRTERLSPLDDPQQEMLLLDKLVSGNVVLALSTGSILSQQTDVDGTVIGFKGESSSFGHKGRLLEVLKTTPKVAAQPSSRLVR